MRVLITNSTDNEEYVKELENYAAAKHWIINHLDSSKEWFVQDITPASRIAGIGKSNAWGHNFIYNEA